MAVEKVEELEEVEKVEEMFVVEDIRVREGRIHTCDTDTLMAP